MVVDKDIKKLRNIDWIPKLHKHLSKEMIILLKRQFFKKPVMYPFAQKPYLDCTSTETVKTISKPNESKTEKEQLKVE